MSSPAIYYPNSNTNNNNITAYIWHTCEFCGQKVKNISQLECGHKYCKGCKIDIKNNKCLSSDCTNISNKPNNSDLKINQAGIKEKSIESKKICEICTETFDKLVILNKCKHEMCSGCKDKTFAVKPQCPFCFTFYGIPTGTQPQGGEMSSRYYQSSLSGYESYGTIEIKYSIPSGTQTKDHPSPGKSYLGITRYAFLPANEKGKKALELLKKAFNNRLIFTIGTSRTTGLESVTWNDIHHKTDFRGP